MDLDKRSDHRKNISKSTTETGVRKTPISYILRGLAGLLLLIVIIIAAGIYYYQSTNYVATVGEQKISQPEYTFYLKNVQSQLLAQAGENVDPATFWSTNVNGEPAIEWAKRNALEIARETKVQLIKAKQAGIKLDKADLTKVEDVIKYYTSQYEGKKSSEIETEFKASSGVTVGEFREVLKEAKLAEKFKQNEMKDVKITDAEIRAYYDKNTDKFKDCEFRKNAEEAVWAHHILVLTVDSSGNEFAADKQKEAKKKAEGILEKAKKGDDFLKLAKDNSEDPGSLSNGGTGDYVFGKGKMDPAFEKAAFELNPGQISGLVKSTYGYHIIKLDEKIAKGKPVSYTCATTYREFLLNAQWLIDLKYREKLENWKKDYKVKINNSVYNAIKK